MFVVLSLIFTVADIVRFPFFSTSPLSCTPFITTPVTVGFALFTVTVHVAYFVPSATDVAVIVAVPSPMALTFPFSSTVATESLSDFHVTDLSLPSVSTVAVSFWLSPASNVTASGETVTPVTVTL